MFSQNIFQKCQSNRSQMFFKTDALINFPIFTRKYLCWSNFFKTVRGLKARNFDKRETPTQVFSFEYPKFFENRFFMEHLRWLLLHMVEEFLRISNSSEICAEEFIKEKNLDRHSGHPMLSRHRFFVRFTSRYRPTTYRDWSEIVMWYHFPFFSIIM